MNFQKLMDTPAKWMLADKKHSSSLVVTSRLRLARNLEGHPFPGWAEAGDKESLFQEIFPSACDLKGIKRGFKTELVELSSLQKQVLVERHLMSREQAARSSGCGVVVNSPQTLSIMINEEDHLRLQAIKPGLQLKEAFSELSKVDDILSEKLNYAYDEELGYLTACPTNLGTGLRASAMLHLPGLVLSNQIEPVLKAVSKLGLAIRGFYGEGTESLGNLFQISNQSTLGESEIDIVSRIDRVIRQVITHEENARLKLFEEEQDIVFDKICRAYATLRFSHILSSKEALNMLSILRLGIEMKFLPEETTKTCDLLMMNIQPAHLQLKAGRKLNTTERDLSRAEIIRKELEHLTPPSLNEGTSEASDDAS